MSKPLESSGVPWNFTQASQGKAEWRQRLPVGGQSCPRRTESITLQSRGDSVARPLCASVLQTRTPIFRGWFSSLLPTCHGGNGGQDCRPDSTSAHPTSSPHRMGCWGQHGGAGQLNLNTVKALVSILYIHLYI